MRIWIRLFFSFYCLEHEKKKTYKEKLGTGESLRGNSVLLSGYVDVLSWFPPELFYNCLYPRNNQKLNGNYKKKSKDKRRS